ncbi:hypothetical protein J4Q44_G00341730 [Coregonus suidteri]|uniref:Uncharacterized protein n=1 Tax=Coregonus suidteri TaxID=861788 RepID=A0AAN8KM57_9TELE
MRKIWNRGAVDRLLLEGQEGKRAFTELSIYDAVTTTCVLANPDATCKYRTTKVAIPRDEKLSCFEPRGRNDPVCGTEVNRSEGCCVYRKDDQVWLKWDEKTTLRCDGTHYGNNDGECSSNQTSLDCDGEMYANDTPDTDTPGIDTPGQQRTTLDETPPASPRERLFLLLPLGIFTVILLGWACYMLHATNTERSQTLLL